MNRNGHVMWSEFILILAMGFFLIVVLREYGTFDVTVATLLSIGAFLFGCTLPDWDHEKVQQKIFFIRPLKYVTKHRGHWHSIVAATIYATILALVGFLAGIVFWWIISASGFFGFVSHLIEDDANRWKLEKKPKRAVKFW